MSNACLNLMGAANTTSVLLAGCLLANMRPNDPSVCYLLSGHPAASPVSLRAKGKQHEA